MLMVVSTIYPEKYHQANGKTNREKIWKKKAMDYNHRPDGSLLDQFRNVWANDTVTLDLIERRSRVNVAATRCSLAMGFVRIALQRSTWPVLLRTTSDEMEDAVEAYLSDYRDRILANCQIVLRGTRVARQTRAARFLGSWSRRTPNEQDRQAKERRIGHWPPAQTLVHPKDQGGVAFVKFGTTYYSWPTCPQGNELSIEEFLLEIRHEWNEVAAASNGAVQKAMNTLRTRTLSFS